MQLLRRTCVLAVVLMCCAVTAQANIVNEYVRAKCDSMRVAMYGEMSQMVGLHQIGFFPERGDATRRLPPEKIDLTNSILKNVTADEDAVLIGATSSRRIDPVHTQGSTTMDVTIQEALQQGRARYINDQTGRRCVVAPQGIANDTTCVYLMIVQRAPGTPSLVPGRTVNLTINLQGIRDTLSELSKRAKNHENRIKRLEDRPPGGLQPEDLGLSGFVGGATYSMAGQTYNGLVTGFTMRYLDIAFEGFIGENLNDSQEMTWVTPQDFLPRFSNNHFEGGSIYWAPPQPYGPGVEYHYRDGTVYREPGEQERYGWFWKLGLTGMHLQRDNIENVSNLEAYYIGGVATLALPLPLATPELSGTVGYSWIREAAQLYDAAPSKDKGLGYGLRLTLVVGRR